MDEQRQDYERAADANGVSIPNSGSEAVSDAGEDRLSNRNLMFFSVGTVGRDFLYILFNSFLLTYILFTKQLNDAQFASISVIIIAARIFDAFNDPIMGGIIENTRTKWGKFKPWILIGVFLTAIVVSTVFSVRLQGWGFIAFLAVMYFAFSVTFTMNDISYWGMLPALATEGHDRNKLTSVSNIFAGIGAGAATVLIPVLTAGKFTLGGTAVKAYSYIAILASIFMITFQMFTLFGVKEKRATLDVGQAPRTTLRQMFKIIFKNDQLMWSALTLLIFSVGTNVVGTLSMTYIYFEFGYKGFLVTLYGLLFGAVYALFLVLFPVICKRLGRNKLVLSCTISMAIGYLIMLLCGSLIPSTGTVLRNLKFAALMIGNGFVGYGQGFYMVMIVCIANTVEYNELKTGKRDEGLIFSLRPFTAKMGSALMQFIVMLVYLVIGVTKFTNQISAVEKQQGLQTAEKADKMAKIIESVPQNKKIALLACMCLIPMLFVFTAYMIYRKKYFLDEAKHAEICRLIAERKRAEAEAGGISAEPDFEEEAAAAKGETAEEKTE